MPALGNYLDSYQKALNALWQYALDSGIVQDLVSMWARSRLKRRRFKQGGHLAKDEIFSEATFLMRGICAAYKPNMARLKAFAALGIYRGLDVFMARSGYPVELPERVAQRRRYHYPRRQTLQEYEAELERKAS